jgi:hypothetical protein
MTPGAFLFARKRVRSEIGDVLMMTNAYFFLVLSVPLVGILANVVLIVMVNGRISQLENRVHTGHDMLVGKVGEIESRLVRLEERLAK